MASLLVRRLDEELVGRLKERARRNGRSAEAEHRAILAAALLPPTTGEELWQQLRGDWPRLDDQFFATLEKLREPARIAELPE
jgi:plasmid stability protein